MTDHAALAEIRREEGLRLEPYLCPTGHLSIGYGRNLEQIRITLEQAEKWLAEDYAAAKHDARLIPEYGTQTKNRQRVLAAMVYQMGLGAVLQFRQLRAALRAGNYNSAADEMLDSLWATQTPARANRLAERMRHDTWPEHGSD